MTQKKQSNDRTLFIDTLRILGPILVIMIHIQLPVRKREQLYYSRLLTLYTANENCIFLVTSGWFCFSNQDTYLQSLVKMIKRVFLPSQIYSLLFVHLSTKPSWSLLSLSMNVYAMLHEILKFKNWAPGGDHLWYIYVYCLTFALKPALVGIHQAIDRPMLKQVHRFLLSEYSRMLSYVLLPNGSPCLVTI